MDEKNGATVTNTAQCLFHDKGWRNKLQHVINELCGKLLPKMYICKMSKILCSCTDGNGLPDSYFKDYRKFTMNSLRTFFDSEFSKSNSLVKTVQPLLMECICSDKSSTFETRWRLLVLLKQCLENNFKMFHFPHKKTVPKQKLLQQKNQLETELEVLFPLEYIQFILGSKGCHIQNICRQYNCEIKFDIKRYGAVQDFPYGSITSASQAAICRPVKVQVFYKDVNSLADMRDAIFHHITNVVEKREKHKTKVDKYKEYRSQYLIKKSARHQMQNEFQRKYGYKLGPADMWGAAVNRKHNASVAYNRKSKRSQKEKNMKRYHKPPPVLQGGVCRNCLQPFRKDTFKKDACRYHPGYLVVQKTSQIPETLEQCTLSADSSSKPEDLGGIPPSGKTIHTTDSYMWSCCGQSNVHENSLIGRQESHIDTGCRTRVHDYQLPKTCNPQGRKSSGSKDATMNF